MHVHSSICLVVGQHLVTTVRLKVVITSLMNGSITVVIHDKNRRKGCDNLEHLLSETTCQTVVDSMLHNNMHLNRTRKITELGIVLELGKHTA